LANKVFQSSNALLLQFVQFAVFAVLQEIGSESANNARCNGGDYFALSHVQKTFPYDFQVMQLQ